MRLLALVLAIVLPAQAMALSCQRPSVERTFDQVNAAAEAYIIVEGRLTVDTRKLPKRSKNGTNARKLTKVPARLQGKSMSAGGFKTPFDKPVTLEVSCIGPWCGSVQNGAEVLAFLKRTGGVYSLQITPCGGYSFGNTPKARKQVTRCFKRGGC